MNGELEITVDRAVAGGRMLGRHEGRVVFVAGAIPGERVRVRVTRSARHSLWADTIEVLEASPDRRPPKCDPACGGLAFVHIAYGRQLALKGQILADAFRRLARLEVDPPGVLASPEAGYRLRARLHVRDGRAGFFLEGTHTLCDAGATEQLSGPAVHAAQAAVTALGTRHGDCDAVVISENVPGSERVIHLEPRAAARLDDLGDRIRALVDSGEASATGVTTIARGKLVALAGAVTVTDTPQTLFGRDAPSMAGASWSRRPTSFFQGSRFLMPVLLSRVLELARGDRVADLYAGVGLFAVGLAARGSQVLAAEGDASSLEDLSANLAPWGTRARVWRGAIEELLWRPPMPPPDAVIVDPPRTGMSAEALDHLAAWGPSFIVYVSCDPATLARDAARLSQQGFRLLSLEALDLFPNTPHVEALAAFARP